MAAPLPLRTDFTVSDLRQWARRTCDANQARRLLALPAIYDTAPISTLSMVPSSVQPVTMP
jgi:hypothetical protein